MQLLPPEVKDLSNLGALALVFVLCAKWFFEYLSRKSESKPELPSIKTNGGNGRAGEKSSEWWELTFARIIRQCLEDHESKVRRPELKEADETRQEILDRIQQLERQLAIAVAEISRQVRDR